MRILHILNDVTDRGNGIVNTAVDLAMEQARQGVEVVVASSGGGYQSLLESAGVAHLTLNQSRNAAQILHAFRMLLSKIREFKPDVVHAHMRTGLLLAWLCRRFRRFLLVGHVHNVHDRESILMGLADCVIAVSESVARTMAAQGIPRGKIRVVLNRTLGSRRVPPLASVQPVHLERPSIVTVGGMNQRKGIAELITAFEQVAAGFPEAHLYLVGDGPDRETFERQAKATQYSGRIHFAGYQAQPQAYMLNADVFVLASRRESFGLVLIEAREAGCAIVATDVDGVAEALDGGRAGLLVPAKNPPALAGAISSLLANPNERSAWQHRAKERVDQFHVRNMAADVTAVYEELLATVRTRSPRSGDDPESQVAHS